MQDSTQVDRDRREARRNFIALIAVSIVILAATVAAAMAMF